LSETIVLFDLGGSMEYKLNLHIEMVENGQYVATSPDVPGLVAQGRTVRETVEIAEDVAKMIKETAKFGIQI